MSVFFDPLVALSAIIAAGTVAIAIVAVISANISRERDSRRDEHR